MEIEIYTVKDIADILKISKSKAYQLANTNGFPSIKMGSTIRVPRSDFENWLKKYTGRIFPM